MRTLIAVLVGIATGFVVGILGSEIIGIASYGLTGNAVGIRFLPLILAAAGGAAAPWLDRRINGRARPGHPS
jgi:hypothetical protein